MNVSLGPQLDAYVRDLVRGGDYASASEVVREGLRMLKVARERDRQQAELRRLIQEGLESPVVSVTRDDVKAMMRERLAARRAEAEGGEQTAPDSPTTLAA